MSRLAQVLCFTILLSVCAFALEFPESEWRQVRRSDPNAETEFTLALKLYNLDVLDELTERVTTPGNPEYRQWRTLEELTKITRPPRVEVKLLMNWLQSHNLQGTDYGDFIQVTGRISDVEQAFETEYHTFESRIFSNLHLDRSIVHPLIPLKFRGLVMFITGVSNFPFPSGPKLERSKARMAAASDVGDLYVVPQTLRKQYSVPVDYVASNANSSQGLVEFGAQAGVSIEDLQSFMSLTGGPANANLSYTVGNFQFHPIDPIDMESTLDVQYIMAMAPGVATSFFVVKGWIYDFPALVTQRISQGLPVPWIFSVSYGWAEAQQCQQASKGTGCGQLGGTSSSYVENTNVALQKLGLLGISVLVASGDAGAASKLNTNCRDQKTPIQPEYPASSNFVTAVGGTMFKTANALDGVLPPFCTEPKINCAGNGVEMVSMLPESLITSGGGFSNVAPTPAWQLTQVQKYLASDALLPPTNTFNSSGRAYPDLSALAHHFMIVMAGRSSAVDGTSASAPLLAGLFALIQDNLLNAGQPCLGFMNPTIYSAVAADSSLVLDVIYGNNTTTEGGGLGAPCTTVGYGTTTGWDIPTGFGTLNYPNMLNYLLKNF